MQELAIQVDKEERIEDSYKLQSIVYLASAMNCLSLLGSYLVALSYLPTPWRLVALGALSLLLVPMSLAQTTQNITPELYPAGGWDSIDGAYVSRDSTDKYYAQFVVHSGVELVITVDVQAKNPIGYDPPATLSLDGVPVANIQYNRAGEAYQLPSGNLNYNATIMVQPGSPSSRIFLYSISAVAGATTTTTTQQSLLPGSIPALTSVEDQPTIAQANASLTTPEVTSSR